MPMAYQSRARKRVHANPIRRASDGSAFQNCESCGTSVAIVLADMHECGPNKNTRKKLKTQCADDQPRSPFRFFMEEFLKTCTEGNLIEKDKKGFEAWKNMSRKEKQPYIDQADKLDVAYRKLLQEEENEFQWVDDEADSAEVGKYDENYDGSEMHYYDSESPYGSDHFLSETYGTFVPSSSYHGHAFRTLLLFMLEEASHVGHVIWLKTPSGSILASVLEDLKGSRLFCAYLE